MKSSPAKSAAAYWSSAAAGSPGSQAAELQAKLYANETVEAMMARYDARVSALLMPVGDDEAETAANRLKAEEMLRVKAEVAKCFGTVDTVTFRSKVANKWFASVARKEALAGA